MPKTWTSNRHLHNPSTREESTIMAFIFMIGYRSWPDCGSVVRESVKMSPDSEDSNASFEVGCAYVWRYRDATLGKAHFIHCQRIIGFHSKSRGAETKHVGNEASALKCMSVIRVTLRQQLTKINLLWWGQLLTISIVQRNIWKLQNRFPLVSCNIAPNFKSN